MDWWLWLVFTALGIVLGLILIYIFFKDLFILAKNSKTLRRILGISLVVIGIIGIFVPVLQGWLLIFIGLSILRIFFLKKLVRKLAAKLGIRIRQASEKKTRNKIYKPRH